MAQEQGAGHGQDDIRSRLARVLRREAEQAESEAGGSEPGQDACSIRERLQDVLAHEKQVLREKPSNHPA